MIARSHTQLVRRGTPRKAPAGLTGLTALTALTALTIALAAVPADASPPQRVATAPYTVDFTAVGEHTWEVPAGVTHVDLTVAGAQGGGGLLLGGQGATVTAQVAVTPGATLDLSVGGAGAQPAGGFGGGADGGTNTLNALLSGGGGGGSSSVALHASGTLLVVAGGGGGASLPLVAGGASGAVGGGTTSGGAGGPGGAGTSGAAGTGGAAGSASLIPLCALGTDGSAGADALQGVGGIGASAAGLLTSGGGGGGGGYTGGGGGGTGGSCVGGTVGLNSGGGGGGSSYVVTAAVDPTITQGAHTGDGAIEIAYVDDAAPTADPAVAPATGPHGWVRARTATVTWNWSDALSGIDPATCATSTPVTSQGTSTETSSCTDQAGNTGTASVTVHLDASRPTIVVKAPMHRTYHRHARVRASYTCMDRVSGIARCAGTTKVHKPLNTRTLGTHTFTVTARDAAGNVAAKKVSYRVIR